MTLNKEISLPVSIGMNRDSHPSELSQGEYIYALNLVSESFNGDNLKSSNEPSNILCSRFSEGFKVIGVKRDINSNGTYIFLSNPSTNVSEIGYLKSYDDIEYSEDAELFCGCDVKKILSDPLELQEAVETCSYEVIINDECNKCLNFSIHHPIRDVELKVEKVEKKIFFTDDYNPPRYINLSDKYSYLFKSEDSCSEDGEIYCPDECPDCEDCDRCIDCEKIKIFQDYQKPCKSNIKVTSEGYLSQGRYELFMAYSDGEGRATSQYFRISEPINIFDENQVITEQPRLADKSNNSIVVELEDISLNFTHYKVVSAEVSNVNGEIIIKKVGVFPTTNSIIKYASNGSIDGEVSLQVLFAKIPKFERTRGLVANDGQLYHYGLTSKKFYNLQKVVTLMSPFLKWQTHVAKENLYTFSDREALHAGYMRNENYGFAIKFFDNTGDESFLFPLTFRPQNSIESKIVVGTEDENDNIKSIIQSDKDCYQDRNYWWQYYNSATASETSTCVNEIESEGVITVSTTETCTNNIEYSGGNISINIPISDDTDLEENFSTLITPIINEYDVGGAYYDVNSDIYVNVIKALNDQPPCEIDTIDSNCTIENTAPIQSDIVFTSANTVEKILNEKDIADYEKTVNERVCNIWELDPITGEPILHEDLNLIGVKSYLRKEPLNEGCLNAIDIKDSFSEDYFHRAITPSSPSSTLFDTYGSTNISKNAIWFKASFGNDDKIIVELSEIKCKVEWDDYSKKEVIITGHNYETNCNNVTTALETYTVDLSDNKILTFNKSNYSGNDIYIAIGVSAYSLPTPHLELTCSCFSMRRREIEYSSIDFIANNIKAYKNSVYSLTCEQSIPKINDCETLPFSEGEFGYYESTKKYPNNKELYDSSSIKVNQLRLEELSIEDQNKFKSIFGNTLDVNNNYILNENACLIDKPIRFYKFPDNRISPFISTAQSVKMQGESLIFPIGVKISNNVINVFLDVAVDNGIISEQQRKSISKYEIYRTDRASNRSIVAKGLLYDTYEYEDRSGRVVKYPNYPYNNLSADEINLDLNNNPIPHKYGGEKNNSFTFHSPDTHFNKPNTNSFSEIYMEGYQYGHSVGEFKQVELHAKHVLLGDKAYKTATTLSIAEVVFELLSSIGMPLARSTSGHPISGIAGAIIATTTGVAMVASSAQKVGRYRYQWLDIFYNNKSPINYAYKYHSEGIYSSLKDFHSPNDSLIRAIKVSKYIKGSNYFITSGTEKALINNTNRESSLFISLGTSDDDTTFLTYKPNYISYDNTGNHSRRVASQTGVCEGGAFESKIASPYISIRNFLPDQYGDIDSIKYINTGYCGNLKNNNNCETIFGGDIKISRMSLKRKMPIFLTHMVDVADKTPFAYSYYANIGRPKFFANFRVEDEEINAGGVGIFIDSVAGMIFPQLNDQYTLDCNPKNSNIPVTRKTKGFFYAPKDSKFYLHYYGVPRFLVESEINLNYRYARKEPWEWFYPNGGAGDLDYWTQEARVPIRYDNEYNYNRTYSRNILQENQRTLPRTYSKNKYDLLSDFKNGIIASEIDRTESEISEPWVIYKPLNMYEFSSSLGSLVDVQSIESLRLLARFENQYMLINPIDTLRERVTQYNRAIGTGIFQQRPIETVKSEIGWGGTQHKTIVTSDIGRFWVDSVRGQVILMPLGEGSPIEISAYKRDGKPSGMKSWFKEQLPFKILKGGIDNLTQSDVDNAYNSAGLSMVWDNRYSRLLLTKKDYIVKKEYVNKLKYEDNKIKIKETNDVVEVSNTDIFEEASFTISYYARKDSWSSFHSYKPNYYIPYSNYFQSGNNNASEEENGVWSHLVTNKSYQVFYGKKYPFTLEVVKKTKLYNGVFSSFDYYLDVRRYHDKYDYSENTLLNFNKAWVYNKNKNSGLLNLINSEKNNYFQQVNYPKYNVDSTDILVGYSSNKWSFNQVYDIVKNQHNNIPIWTYDNVWCDKKINNEALSYNNGWKERIRGDYYVVRLQQDKDTRYNFIYRWGITEDITTL